MEQEQAFRQAIEANPGDDLNWQALADWLEEQGDPRHEVVRLSLWLRREPDASARTTWENRLRSLLARGVRPWVAERRLALSARVHVALVLIPPGTFWMGGPEEEGGSDFERPRHRVTLTKGFYMGFTPVTQGQWRAFTGERARCWRGSSHPVAYASLAECRRFCRTLSKRVRKVIRLPTEAEWEYACRAGTSTPYHTGRGARARKRAGWFSCGNEGISRETTLPVGQYEPNAFGLHDMHGNVSEWCQDRFAKYPAEPVVDPLVVAPEIQLPGLRQVARGGKFMEGPLSSRAASRQCEFWARDYGVGFRIVMSLD
jgi:uncharacterized protein (TIGR02996 family)